MNKVQTYEDPLISLVKDPELNRSKEKSNELLKVINNFQSKEQHRIKKKCILGFQVLRDLERLELRTKNWEFLSLDFSIESILNDDKISETKSKFNGDIARKVLSNCVEMHGLINDICDEIDDLNMFIKSMNTIEYISDPGTILTQLTLRIINLKNKLSDNLTILYSKLKLINIGIDLERLLENCDFEKFSQTTITSYREFINQLLGQLNDAIKWNDSIEILECIEIINDVEQMFQSISQNNKNYLTEHENITVEQPEHDDIPDDSFDMSMEDSSEDFIQNSNSSHRLFDKRRRRLSISSISTNTSVLQKTTLQDELPHLMTLFDTARTVEEEIREIRNPLISSSSTTNTKVTSPQPPINRHKQKPVYFGPSLPPGMMPHNNDNNNKFSQLDIPQQESFIPSLSNSYYFDHSSSILSKLGIRPQAIEVDASTTQRRNNNNNNNNNNKNATSLSNSTPPKYISSGTSSSILPNKYSKEKGKIPRSIGGSFGGSEIVDEGNNKNDKKIGSSMIGINSVWNLVGKPNNNDEIINNNADNNLTESNLSKLNNDEVD